MTVYCSLKNFIAKSIIYKSNINKSYLLFYHSHTKNHNSFIAICKKCGNSEELLTDLFSSILSKAKLKNLELSIFDMKILTKCKDCK